MQYALMRIKTPSLDRKYLPEISANLKLTCETSELSSVTTEKNVKMATNPITIQHCAGNLS